MPSASQIIPIILGDNARTLNAAADLGRQGYHVPGCTPTNRTKRAITVGNLFK